MGYYCLELIMEDLHQDPIMELPIQGPQFQGLMKTLFQDAVVEVRCQDTIKEMSFQVPVVGFQLLDPT